MLAVSRYGSTTTALTAQLKPVMEQLAAHYFLKAKSPRGGLIDSVARFHLGNGARLERIDWLGDTLSQGPARVRQSDGELSVSVSTISRRTTRSLCRPLRDRGIERGEKAAEE